MIAMKKQVLFVDDDARLLQGLGRMLRPMRKLWDMEFAYGGPAGIEEIKNKAFDVVVSDMRMPEVNGVDLLKEVSRQCPNSVRIVLSGEAKEDAVYQVLKYAHQYIAKPCSAEGLQNRVQKACEVRDVLSQSKLQQSICNVIVLGSSSKCYEELIQELAKDDPCPRTVTSIIASDVAMSVKVLQFANSAFFGGNNKVLDVFSAIRILGLDVIRELCARGHIVKSQSDELRINKGRLISTQSNQVAKLSYEIAIAEGLTEKQAQQAYTIGLLHNLGLHILAHQDPDKLRTIIEFASKNNCWLSDAEQEVFGTDSRKLGGALLTLWGIPSTVSSGVANFSNAPDLPRIEFDSVACVHCAYQMCYGKEGISQDAPFLKAYDKSHKVDSWLSLLAKVIR